MASITFVTVDGEEITAQGNSGSLMNLAVENSVEGIDGDCGGVCSCATCHVHVARDQFDLVGPPNDIEMAMLELEDSANETSRLSCQIEISDALDGLRVQVAER